jgi:hypothetical protein
MKEFDFELKNLSKGLVPDRVVRKDTTGLEDCHNLEPIADDYQLHEFVVDMNTDSYAWGNP